jgi:DNA-binding transcriptional regulator YiaG
MTPQQLRSLRRKLGLSQRGLAELLDYDLRTIQRWEAGDMPIPKVVELALKNVSAAT